MDQLPLIQISDLHIGEVLVHNSFGFISGHHEHDIQLCQGLSLGYEDARKRYRLKGNETLYTLVSGDVSAAGREAGRRWFPDS